nr:hypothetical protein [Francisella persica]
MRIHLELTTHFICLREVIIILTALGNLISYSSKYSIIATGLVNANKEFLVYGQNDQDLRP